MTKDFFELREYYNSSLPMEEPTQSDVPTSDEKSMAMRQAKFIRYVGEELLEYLINERDFPEWMQNKLSALHQSSKDMYAVMAGDNEDNMDESVNEKLKVSDGAGKWISDFKKSDAPQFRGKSEKERRDMALAAYLSAKRGDRK